MATKLDYQEGLKDGYQGKGGGHNAGIYDNNSKRGKNIFCSQ